MTNRKHSEKTGREFDLEQERKPDEGLPEVAQSTAESAGSPALDSASATLAEQLAKLQTEKEELRSTLIRRQADFENYRKRLERERLEGGQRAVAKAVEALLPVLDAFERALAAHDDPAYEEYRKGFELIYRQLWDALARHGLQRIDAAGQKFDPHIHQALERIETEDHDEGTIVEAVQPGYKFGDRLLRPAIVRVAVHPVARTTGEAN